MPTLCKDVVTRCVQRLNAPALIARHLVGPTHSRGHHYVVGGLVMVIGVAVASGGGALLASYAVPMAHGACDLVGYALHAVGLTPFAERLLTLSEEGVA